MKKVVWLCSWYPNRTNAFDGDFIQRHARAVSRFCHVHVIYVVKEKNIINAVESEEKTTGQLTEQIIYYSSHETGIKPLDRFLSQKNYDQCYRKAINTYIEANGKPDLVHVHVAMKAGLAALWIKKKWNIPFIVSEHWTGYLAEADERLADQSFVYRKLTQDILQEAKLVTVVSEYLGKAIKKHFPSLLYKVIPNVVDTAIFYPAYKEDNTKLKLVHASNMNYQKNCEAILQALQLLKNEGQLFEMHLYGPVQPKLQEMIISLGLQENVFLMGEVLQPVLAEAMRQSDALVLYSRFETFGCVLIEANACGIPAIVSELEVFHELITENVNGIFVKGDDARALATKLIEFAKVKSSFDKTAISKNTVTKYNYDSVGKQMAELYQ